MDYIQRFKDVLALVEENEFIEDCEELFKETAFEYKHRLSGRFILTNPSEIKKIEGSNICITRKIDGEMRTVFFNGKKAVMYTTGGKMEEGLPCLKGIEEKLRENNIKAAGLVCELNFIKSDRSRSRVSDVIHALATPSLHNLLALTPFDILFLGKTKWDTRPYEETHKKLMELFNDGSNTKKALVLPVQMEKGKTSADIERIYKKWVVEEKAEGLVVHTEQPVIWKIKPLHTIDAAVIGYTTGENGIRDLLFAVMEPSGLYRIFASGSNGLSLEQRKSLALSLAQKKVSSNLIYSDSQGVAFQLVKPEYVFEVSAIDFANTNCLNASFKNFIVAYSEKDGWLLRGKAPGVVTYNLSIVRLREDKQCIEPDIAVHQIQDLCPFPNADTESQIVQLPESTLEERKIFFKRRGRNCYVKKFVLLKTNKEETGRFSKYILHFTDYSSNRKEKMKISVWCSSDKTELQEKMHTIIYKSIRSGWASM